MNNFNVITFNVSNTDITGTEKMRIQGNGNVGIGTSVPDSKLQVEGGELRVTTSNSGVALYLSLGNGEIASYNWGVGGGWIPLVHGGSEHRFNTSGTERMRITSSGNLFIGLTSGGAKLELAQSTSNWAIISRMTASSGTQCQGILSTIQNQAPNNTSNYLYYGDDNIAPRFVVYSNGGIANYQSNNVNLSDERTKKDIEPLESYWDKFKDIEIVKFKYKDQTHDDFNIGVIAQQVEAVAPEFVDVDGWGKNSEGEEPLKSIYTSDLHHATIKVLKEAITKIEILEAKILVLENK